MKLVERQAQWSPRCPRRNDLLESREHPSLEDHEVCCLLAIVLCAARAAGSDHIVGVSTNTAVACALAHAHVVARAIVVAPHHGEPACK